jgi:hypothetical protein
MSRKRFRVYFAPPSTNSLSKLSKEALRMIVSGRRTLAPRYTRSYISGESLLAYEYQRIP